MATDLSRSLTEVLEQCAADSALRLPICPPSARRLGPLLERAAGDESRLAPLLSADPVLATAVVREANGPAYAGLSPLFALAPAVERIGPARALELTDSIVRDDVLRDPDPLLLSALESTWRHSVGSAAVARLVAESRNAKELADDCELLGLTADIGVVFLVGALASAQLGRQQAAALTATAKREVLRELHATYRRQLLLAWNFPSHLAGVYSGHALHPDERERSLIMRLAAELTAAAGLRPAHCPLDDNGADRLWELAELMGLEDVELAALQVRSEDLLAERLAPQDPLSP